MKTVSSSEIRKFVRENGQSSWVAMTLKYGKTFRVGGIVFTCEPEAVQALLMDKVHTEVRSTIHSAMRHLPGANGILFLDGDPWLRRVKALMPAFHREHVDSFPASLQQLTLRHIEKWMAQGRVPDLASAIQQLGLASVLRMGYGLDPEHPLVQELGRALVQYKQGTMNPDVRYRLDEMGMDATKLLQLPWIVASVYRSWRHTGDVLNASKALLADRSACLTQPGWFAGLAEAGFSHKDFANEINHLYGAFNAIDYVTTCALYELARDQALTRAIRNELSAQLPDKKLPSREDLARLPLTRGFMLEILRMYPVSMAIVRRTGAALRIGTEELAKGTEVMILLHATQNHPDFWEEPARLNPARWAESDLPRVPFSYVPFLDGLRKCVGRSMAEMQLLIVMTTIVRNCDLGVFADAVIPPLLIPRFANPLPFVVQTPLPA